MLRSAVLLAAVASASCFAPAAHMPNAAAVQRRSVAVLMNAPVEEKKGFLGMFGKKEEVSGKVVPTGAKVRTTTQMSARDRTPYSFRAAVLLTAAAMFHTCALISSFCRSAALLPWLQQEEEELSESKKLLQKVKDAGVAGIISYIFWEWAFWGVSIPVCVFGYYEVTGHLPDFSNQDDVAKLGAEAFAFVNVARFAVPLRIGLALSTTPWVQDNVVNKIGFLNKDKEQ